MSEMIEMVARAMSELDRPKQVFSKEMWWRVRGDDFTAKARAAIETMREPTEAMISEGEDTPVGAHYCGSASAIRVYQAMIDAALKDTAP